MGIGQCVKVDFGFLGCKADVTDITSGMCAGKRSCDVPVSHAALVNSKHGCPELTLYLEVTYVCV